VCGGVTDLGWTPNFDLAKGVSRRLDLRSVSELMAGKDASLRQLWTRRGSQIDLKGS